MYILPASQKKNEFAEVKTEIWLELNNLGLSPEFLSLKELRQNRKVLSF